MKIYLAGSNGKQKILALHDSIFSKWDQSSLVHGIKAVTTDRQTDRQTDDGYLLSRRDERQSESAIRLNNWGGYNLDRSVFLAGNGYHKTEDLDIRKLAEEVCRLEDFNILESYYMLRENEDFLKLLVRCNSFLLDSGAFTFMQGTHQGEINWDEYIEKYADLINRWDVKLFFELDIDCIVGLSEVDRLRNKLEKLTNKQPIPVWHKNRGKDYYIRMCEQYPYVSIGGIVTREIPRNIYEKAFPWFIQTAHQHGCKIHGLGYTNIAGLHKYHFDSVDSTAWLYGNRGGYIYKFKPDEGTLIQLQPEGNMRLKARKGALNNFIEWIKFSKYAEKYL